MLKSLKTSEIKVETRFRKNLGNIKELAESIRENGLLQPIGINKDNQLVFGLRRLRAVEKLGWPDITTIEVDCEEGEFIENSFRKDLEIEERVEIAEHIFKKYGGKKGQRKDLPLYDGADVLPKGTVVKDYAAKQAGFGSRASFKMAQDIIKSKNAFLIERYRKGNISLTAACKKIAELKKNQQGQFNDALRAENRLGGKVERLFKEIKKNKQKEKIAKIVSDLPPISDRHQLYNENCLNALKTFKAGSVNVVISDPPYDKPNLACYSIFGKVCNHVLKDGGLVICSANHAFTGDHIKRMEAEGFSQLWEIATVFEGPHKNHNVVHKNLMSGWRPWLVFVKGNEITSFEKSFNDVIKVKDEGDYESKKGFFEWQQSVQMMEELVKKFSEKGDTVLDPFMGTGSTGIAALNLDRKFIGYEIDTENNRFNVAKHRIENEVKQ